MNARGPPTVPLEEIDARLTRRLRYQVLLVIGLNGFALLHLSVVPELGGFIAATLLADMFTGPIILWAVYVGTAEGAAPKAAMNWVSAPQPPVT